MSTSLSLVTISSFTPVTSSSNAINVVALARHTPEGTEDCKSYDSSDLAANIARLAQLNDLFIQYRYIPGTATLCRSLADQIVYKDRKGNPD